MAAYSIYFRMAVHVAAFLVVLHVGGFGHKLAEVGVEASRALVNADLLRSFRVRGCITMVNRLRVLNHMT